MAQQLAGPINLLHEKYLKVFLGSPTHRLMAISAAQAFEQHFLPEHLAEVTAIAKQTSMSVDDAAFAQCFLDRDRDDRLLHHHPPRRSKPDHVTCAWTQSRFPVR